MYTRAYVYIDHVIFATFWLFQENSEKIKVFKVLPYLVSNVVEVRGTAEVLYVHVCVCDSELVESIRGENPSLAVTCTPLHVYTGRLCVVHYCSLIPVPCVCCVDYILSQLLDITPGDQAEEEGGHMDLDAQRKGKAAVIKTSTRQASLGPNT